MPELRTCDDASAWDAFVSQASDASVLQAWAWGSLKSRYGWGVQRYFWTDHGTAIGAVAVLRRRLPGGLALNYAPRGPILGGRLDQWPGFWQALRERLAQESGTVLKVDPEWTTDAQRAVLTGAVMLFFGPKLIYLYGGTRGDAKDLKPGYLLHWRAIEDAQRRGCTTYDMWGVPLDPQPGQRGYGYYVFKSRFNGRMERFIGLYDLPVNRAATLTIRLAERFARAGQPEFV